jgi:hypothetical protein
VPTELFSYNMALLLQHQLLCNCVKSVEDMNKYLHIFIRDVIGIAMKKLVCVRHVSL